MPVALLEGTVVAVAADRDHHFRKPLREICEDLRRAGFDVHPDELGENVTTASIELERLPLETLLSRGPTAVHRTDRCPDALRLDRSFPFRIEEAHD